MRLLFIFLDGVGLGEDNSERNPFAGLRLPNLTNLLRGARLLAGTPPIETESVSFYALDACLGVGNNPQSATGQATLLTGRNIPQRLGYHYGPKPNEEIAAEIHAGTVFHVLQKRQLRSGLLNAYPSSYFEAIYSGRRLLSAIPLAVTSAGLPLMTTEDLLEGRALSADFTGKGWREHLKIPAVPLYQPEEAGQQLCKLAENYNFAFFEYWLSDMIGHRQDMEAAADVLGQFDQVLGGLLKVWDKNKGLILITSDHGNLENLDTRKHTQNPVPLLLIGSPTLRKKIGSEFVNLTDIAPAILRFFE